MKNHITLIGIFLLSLIFSCNNSNKSQIGVDFQKEATLTGGEKFEEETPESVDLGDEKIEKKIIKTADIDLKTADYEKTVREIKQLTSKYKGNIVSEAVNKNDYGVYCTMTIRVPAENFDSLLVNIGQKAEGEVLNKKVNIEDITEHYIDIYLRLKNKKQVHQQYLEYLKKAKTINDILNVQEHLRQITEEIEVAEGKLKYYDSLVSMSTINITITQEFTQDYGFFGKIAKAFRGGWQGLLAFIVGLVYLWPFILIIGVIVYLIVRKYKRKRQRKNKI